MSCGGNSYISSVELHLSIGTTSDPNCPFGNDRLYLLAMWARPLYGARAPHPSLARIEGCGARFIAVFDFRTIYMFLLNQIGLKFELKSLQ